ncbi:MAG: SIS domain-containing protein, partial [Clostridia bacterium]|nr:SIS domain-containing protein [Clostridia bacterium]
SEAFAAGELKHGPISLIDEVSPTVAISTQSYLAEKLASNVNEVRSRQGKVWTVCKKADRKLFEGISSVIELPDFDEMFLPIPTIVPLQLIAYYVALYKGCDIDKPRNLAKSVTVE